MQSAFKHPQIFADMLGLCQRYYPLHNSLPKPFRFSVGERILAEQAEILRLIILANLSDKNSQAGRSQGADHVRQVRASVEVIRGFFLLGWKMKMLSNGAMTELSQTLEAISKQAARWEQWFNKQPE